MALYIEFITKDKNKKPLVVFRGGGKQVWRPTLEDIALLATQVVKLNKNDKEEMK